MTKATCIATTVFLLAFAYNAVEAQQSFVPSKYASYYQDGSTAKVKPLEIAAPKIQGTKLEADPSVTAPSSSQDSVISKREPATSKQDPMPSTQDHASGSDSKHEEVVDCGCEVPEKKEEKKKEDEPVEYSLSYKKGFLIAPKDKEKSPYSLRINGRSQFRYAGFSPDADTFTNQGGTIDLESQSGFEIERARIEFRGFFINENLTYYFNLDGDTDDNHQIIFHDFWVDYRISDLFNIRVGKAKVPASYEWLESSSTTRFADRSVSTTFFRADRSTGVWFFGESKENNFYWQTAIVNGFVATDLDQGDIDDVFSYAGLAYWDPLGDFGKGHSDIKHTKDLKLRFGISGAFSNQNPFADGSNTEEVGFAQISDGTDLVAPGALGAGLTVNDFDLYLVSLFSSGKYRGWSWNSEFYARWLQDIETIEGPVPVDNKLFDSGFYTDVGYTIVPNKFEVIGRISNVDGLFGDAWEYAGGANWFLNGTHKHKITFDATILDGNPSSSSSPNFSVGQNGVLYRLQYQAAF